MAQEITSSVIEQETKKITTKDFPSKLLIELKCTHCGYNLHMQPVDAGCPECGRKVAESLKVFICDGVLKRDIIEGLLFCCLTVSAVTGFSFLLLGTSIVFGFLGFFRAFYLHQYTGECLILLHEILIIFGLLQLLKPIYLNSLPSRAYPLVIGICAGCFLRLLILFHLNFIAWGRYESERDFLFYALVYIALNYILYSQLKMLFTWKHQPYVYWLLTLLQGLIVLPCIVTFWAYTERFPFNHPYSITLYWNEAILDFIPLLVIIFYMLHFLICVICSVQLIARKRLFQKYQIKMA